MARRIVFTDSGFWKYSWAHLVMSMTESCRWVSSEGLKTTGNQQRSSALSLTHRDISSLSEYFDDVIHCSTLSQIGEPLLIFTSERLCLSNARYTPSRRQSLFVGRLSFLSVFRARRLKLALVCFFGPIWHVKSASELVGPSDHSDWLFSWRTSGRRLSSIGLVCQSNFGPGFDYLLTWANPAVCFCRWRLCVYQA